MVPDKTTNNSWNTIEFRDQLTNRLVAIEIVPVDDLQEHESSEACNCIPTLKWEKHQNWIQDISLLIHNSFDGRETLFERGH